MASKRHHSIPQAVSPIRDTVPKSLELYATTSSERAQPPSRKPAPTVTCRLSRISAFAAVDRSVNERAYESANTRNYEAVLGSAADKRQRLIGAGPVLCILKQPRIRLTRKGGGLRSETGPRNFPWLWHFYCPFFYTLQLKTAAFACLHDLSCKTRNFSGCATYS
ncbi:hypothetical protein K491DRAFT_279083 [Lophiostoma macrostomum CBS 122681]|uniref:Uncharacterized protein n=1 Tax=Lophiostoma macrostomum CBS 122681 TaxID=1314788 RepID=A0A6A6SL98_9PLEO|nr:hypothetical protein K491DRAFT_279083 [Lophiostoma macrostomum CBS 122681]